MAGNIFATVLFILLFSLSASAAGPDDILGTWNNQEKDARIEMFKCGERYCGKVVWMLNPDYPEGSTEGLPGTPKLDNNNPDARLRSLPRLGLVIVRDFRYAGDGLWKEGTVYDPKSGKSYSGKMTQTEPNRLDLRGFIGISLIGRTTTWTR